MNAKKWLIAAIKSQRTAKMLSFEISNFPQTKTTSALGVISQTLDIGTKSRQVAL